MKVIKMLPSKLTSGVALEQCGADERKQWERYVCAVMQTVIVQYLEEHPANQEEIQRMLTKK